MLENKNVKKIIMVLSVLCLMMCPVSETVSAAGSSGTSLSAQTKKIVGKQTKTSDSKKKKLKKLFKYVEKNYGYKRVMGFKTYDGWEGDYAKEMYSEKKGSCYHFAAAYGYLAKKATGYKVRIGIGKTNGFSGKLQSHAWTEVKINSTWYICDTNMDKFAEKSSGKYFMKKRNSMKKVYGNFKKVKYFTVAI